MFVLVGTVVYGPPHAAAAGKHWAGAPTTPEKTWFHTPFDQPLSPAVDSTHHRVDLYGYVSMVVATLQIQEREIAELRKELEQAHRNSPTRRPARK